MRIGSATALALWTSTSALWVGCAGSPGTDEGAVINPGTLGGPAADVAADAVGERYIVKLRDPVRGAGALRAAGAHVVLALPRESAVAAHVPTAALAGLSRNPNVEYIEPDAVRQPLAEVVPYGIPLVQADQVEESAGPIAVCIIDSGYSWQHEDLAGTNVTGSQDIGSGSWSEDLCGHGTHVAGIVSARGGNDVGVRGVNTSGSLRMHIVKVFGGAACDWTYSSSLVKALGECRAALGNRIVVNMSLGGTMKSRTEENAFKDAWAAGVLSIAAAGNDGNTRLSYPASYASVISVAAVDANQVVAGFSQKNAAVDLAAPGVAVLSTVPWHSVATVTAGGATYSGSAMQGAASSQGATGALVAGGLCDAVGAWAGKVVLCRRGDISFYDKVRNAELGGAVAVIISNNAPGNFSGTLGDGTSAIPAIAISLEDGQALEAGALGQAATVVSSTLQPASGYEAWDGTSMATPYVAGVAALVWNRVPTATNVKVRDALTASARDLGPAGRDDAYGYGLVQAAAALARLGGSPPTCTPTAPTESSCSNGADDDCDGATDSADSDCQGGGGCTLGQKGAPCTVPADCCSNSCGGKKGSKTCR